MALAIGYARSGHANAAFQTRYSVVALPMLCCAFFIWDLYSPARFHARFAKGLLLLLPLFVIVNGEKGIRNGRGRHDWMHQIALEAQSGLSPNALASRYGEKLQCDPLTLERYFEHLRAARLGPYAERNAGISRVSSSRGGGTDGG